VQLFNPSLSQPENCIKLADDKKHIIICFKYNEHLLELVKELPKRKFNKQTKNWVAPLNFDTIRLLSNFINDFAVDINLYKEIENLKERYNTLYQSSNITEAQIELPVLKRELFKFQQAGVYLIEERSGRVLLTDDLGVGKTTQSLAWLQLHPELRPAIIVCPAFLKYNWAKEIQKVLPDEEYNEYVILEGRKKVDINKPIIIINYDIISYWLKTLKKINPKVIILDEAHYIKNTRTKRAKSVISLGKKTPHILALTGTPILNKPIELWSIVHLLAPHEFNDFRYYVKRYCDAKQKPWGWDYSGASNLKELNKKLRATIMIRRTKDMVLKDLPNRIRTSLVVDISNREEYDLAEKDFIQWLKQQGYDMRKIMQITYNEALTQLNYLKQLAGRGKLEATTEWINNFLENEQGKLVVFGHYKKNLYTLHENFPEALIITGDTNMKKRNRIVEEFQNNRDKRLLIASIGATGVGLNFTAASNVLFLELMWIPALHEQAEARCHRIGSKETVNIWYMIGNETIDEHIYQVLQQKTEISSAILEEQKSKKVSKFICEVLKQYVSTK
jgi:SWI/SNF-related matrix-associated actin-dependent regulator 1 of chromatin subfamily A